jgi:hypothetical protein
MATAGLAAEQEYLPRTALRHYDTPSGAVVALTRRSARRGPGYAARLAILWGAHDRRRRGEAVGAPPAHVLDVPTGQPALLPSRRGG